MEQQENKQKVSGRKFNLIKMSSWNYIVFSITLCLCTEGDEVEKLSVGKRERILYFEKSLLWATLLGSTFVTAFQVKLRLLSPFWCPLAKSTFRVHIIVLFLVNFRVLLFGWSDGHTNDWNRIFWYLKCPYKHWKDFKMTSVLKQYMDWKQNQ